MPGSLTWCPCRLYEISALALHSKVHHARSLAPRTWSSCSDHETNRRRYASVIALRETQENHHSIILIVLYNSSAVLSILNELNKMT